jgi:hypothetical protein
MQNEHSKQNWPDQKVSDQLGNDILLKSSSRLTFFDIERANDYDD